jgi:putative ABC transport system ATP-binding protein
MDHFPAQLSGGEQQRVAVARALAKRPTLLLCDEPTGALDLQTGVRVLEALVEINGRYGSTTLVVTHNADVARLGTRVIHFLDGRIRAIETNTVRARPSDLKW